MLGSEQVQSADYDAVVTISHQVATTPGVHPIAVDKRASFDAHFSRGIGRREASNQGILRRAKTLKNHGLTIS